MYKLTVNDNLKNYYYEKTDKKKLYKISYKETKIIKEHIVIIKLKIQIKE